MKNLHKTTLTIALSLSTAALAQTSDTTTVVEATTHTDTVTTTESDSAPGAMLDTSMLADMFAKLDSDNNGMMSKPEAAQWLYGALFYESLPKTEDAQINISQAIETLAEAAETQTSVIEPRVYEALVMAAYEDGILTKDEIYFMSGENIFSSDSPFVDPQLSYATLITKDTNGDGELTLQEIMGEDLETLRKENPETRVVTTIPAEQNSAPTRTNSVTRLPTSPIDKADLTTPTVSTNTSSTSE